MKNTAPKRRPNYVSDHADDIDPSNASSATDCTGLMPALPRSEYEIESYKAVYDFLPDEKDEIK